MPSDSDLSLDSQLLLNDVRLRVLNRQPVTPDEYRKLLSSLRGDRENAARASAAAKRTAKRVMGATATPSISVTDLFPQMKTSRG
jgi:hypothetical protein